MPWSWFLNWLTGLQKTAALMSRAALAGSLIACSTQRAPDAAPAAHYMERPEQCSTVGVIACKAMALLSSDTVSTCSVSTARDGQRTEICGYVPAQAKPAEPAPAAAKLYPVHISWSDNSDNESNFVIERCDQVSIAPEGEKTVGACTGSWRSIATVGANTTSYVDNTAVANHTYLYRVKATNNEGSSGYTQETAITTPMR